MKKIMLLANTGWFIYNFRLSLLKNISQSNYEVVVIAPYDKYTQILKGLGYKVYDWKLNRSSLNPFLELFSILNLIKRIHHEKPDLIHNFTIKACLYGTIASRITNVRNVINSITGLGPLFINNKITIRIIRLFLKPVYSFIFNLSGCKMIFENFEDQKYFIKIGIIKNRKNSFLIEGSGVDSEFFKPSKDDKYELAEPVKLLFPSRLILEKGIEEVLVAHNQLLKKGQDIQLYIAGETDNGNRSSIKKKFIKKMNQNKNIFFLGHRSDMREVFSNSDIVVLPSWREGLSKSLIEAGSMEKPIITTDTPGCRNIIDHGINGLLVPVKDPKALELAILFFIKNKIIAENFGKNLRLKVQKKFDIKKINSQTMALYKKFLT